MFSRGERNHVRDRLLNLAEADASIVGAAIRGSLATGSDDEWSDIDLTFSIEGDLAPVLDRFTAHLYGEFGAIHHWDLQWGSVVYRVFLLPGCLEVDIAFSPASEFGPRGRQWRTVFGDTVRFNPVAPPRADDLAGRAWHHLRCARACIERGALWQAEWLISGVRDNVLALACVRGGQIPRQARGADALPSEVTAPVEEAFIRSLDEPELRRALRAAADALQAEIFRTDPGLAQRLAPTLSEITDDPVQAKTTDS
jgi:hypothetical protein